MDRETLVRTLDHDLTTAAVRNSKVTENKGKEIIIDRKRNFYET